MIEEYINYSLKNENENEKERKGMFRLARTAINILYCSSHPDYLSIFCSFLIENT